MTLRAFAFLFCFLSSCAAHAQYQSPATPDAAGGACTGSNFEFPDANGHILQCNGSTWQVVGSGGGVTGSGTTNYVARWTSSTALGTGVVYDNGTNVGIGTASPHAMIHDTGGIIIGPDATSCTSANNGEIRYTSGGTPPYNWCNGSAWVPFDPCPQTAPYSAGDFGSGCCGWPYAIWGDGTYIYEGEVAQSYPGDYLLAYTFNESTHVWTLKNSTQASMGDVLGIWGDGTYIYTVENNGSGGTSGLEAWTFNGTSYTKKGTYSTSMVGDAIWGQGGYIFVADDANGVKAFSFSGSAFTLKATYKPTSIVANAIWGDGTTLYVSDSGNNKIRALTFNGTSFTAGGTISSLSASVNQGLIGDGTYIYIGVNFTAVYAYSYNGSTFTSKATLYPAGYVGPLYAKNGILYESSSGGTDAYTFNGTTFTYLGRVPFTATQQGLWSDGTFLFSTTSGNNNQTFGADANYVCY